MIPVCHYGYKVSLALFRYKSSYGYKIMLLIYTIVGLIGVG